MIILDLEQGSEEWHLARLGIPTASNFAKIITSTGKLSTSATGYMHKLIAEYLMEKPIDIEKTEWMERGNELEADARGAYEFITDTTVDEVGLIYKDDKRLVSASPDGLINSDGGLEIKCPSPAVHVEYLLANKCPSKYLPQVMGCMYVTGRIWWDFMSYHPDLDPLIVRVNRDEELITKMDEAINKFIVKMLDKRNQLTKEENAA